MRKLFVVVEGASEEQFVRAALRDYLPHLDPVAIKVETGRSPAGRPARGGGDWTKWVRDIRNVLLPSSRDRVVTTLFDLYGLPPNFPGVDTRAAHADTSKFADALEQAMVSEVPDSRFIPNLLRHEFETLVLASLSELEQMITPSKREGLAPLRAAVAEAAPEQINCGKTTAPSKRLQAADIGFSKLVHGVPAVKAAGIPKLKVECPRFGAWISKLEKL